MEKVLIKFQETGNSQEYYRQWPVALLPIAGDHVSLQISGESSTAEFKVIERKFVENSPEFMVKIKVARIFRN